MGLKAKVLLGIAGFTVLCISVSAFGQNATVNFTGITTSQSFGYGYVPPYFGTVSVNGTTLANSDLIICDDYYDEIYIPETWSANAVKASSLTAANVGNTLFGGAGTIGGNSVGGIGLSGYAAIASLVQQLFAAPPNTQAQVDLSSAIWFITSGGTVDQGSYNLAGYDLSAAAATDVQNAWAFGNSTAGIDALAADTNLWILTPDPNLGAKNPQEMWTKVPRTDVSRVPEGGAAIMYLLPAGLACFGAMWFSCRNRSRRRETV